VNEATQHLAYAGRLDGLVAAENALLRLERLQAVSDLALAHLELDDLLFVLLPRIREILEADTCAVLLLDPSKQELVARAAVGIEEEVERGVRIPVGMGFAGRVAGQRRPVILPDVDHADVLNPILRQKGIKSLLGVPLLVDDCVIGVLHVGTLVPREFNDNDVELLQHVAYRVALAVERAQLHEQLIQFDEMRANFVAIASHELRTPATSVFGAVATLIAHGDNLTPDTQAQLLKVAYQQGERLTTLLNQLLDLSQLDAKRLRIAPKPLVVRSLLQTIAEDALPADVSIEVEAPNDLAAIADPAALDRILTNLLVNAYRHGSLPIRLAAEQTDTHLRITVEDHGDGVPPELRTRLFERFERGPGTNGSGLGLAIARAYAIAHGGDLFYHHDQDGHSFELVVPSHRRVAQLRGS
jgi:signal transduction histidine kinase